jgi:hypothetical protein
MPDSMSLYIRPRKQPVSFELTSSLTISTYSHLW